MEGFSQFFTVVTEFRRVVTKPKHFRDARAFEGERVDERLYRAMNNDNKNVALRRAGNALTRRQDISAER